MHCPPWVAVFAQKAHRLAGLAVLRPLRRLPLARRGGVIGRGLHAGGRRSSITPPLRGSRPSPQAKADAVGGGSRGRLTETESRPEAG